MKNTFNWALAAMLTTSAGMAMGADTAMKYVSTSGDYIGQGLTQTFTAPGASINASGSAGQAHVTVSDAQNGWWIDFAAPDGSALQPGIYPAAARYRFQSPMGAGLSMWGDGRGCNTSNGWFRVREYALDGAGNVKKLAIDYQQNCEVTGPPLYGSVRVNSTIPLWVPETAAVAGADFAVFSGDAVTLDGTQSFSRTYSPKLAYQWTQLDGPAVTLDDPSSPTPKFVAPDVDLDGATLRFQLSTTNVKGHTKSDDVIVIVNNAAAPRTQITFHGDAGDYITGGQAYAYDTHNAVINFSRNYAGGLSASINGNTWWNFDSAPATGKTYKPGVYKNAERFPFESPGAPGLSLDGDGRGCNTLTGTFTVYQAKFDDQGNPSTADVTFEQHCEGGAPAAYGELVLNSVPHAKLARQLRDARSRFPRR